MRRRDHGRMTGEWVAAEGKQRLPGGIIRGTKGWMSPAGRLHAVEAEADQTVCGESLRGLVEFRELSWDGLQTGVRCRHCVQVLSGG